MPSSPFTMTALALPLNNYFDTGFPHVQAQYSAFNATCWAMMALLLAVELAKTEHVVAC
jgi:hypothetical protein